VTIVRLFAVVLVACSSSSSGDDSASEAGALDASDASLDGGTALDAGAEVSADSSSAGDAGPDVGGPDAADAANDAASAPDAPPTTGARCDTGYDKIYEAGDGNLRGAFASLYWYAPLGDGGSEEHFCYSNPAPSSCECSVLGTCVLPNACPVGAPCGVTMADGIPGNFRMGSCF
jgi:hypothetical protein